MALPIIETLARLEGGTMLHDAGDKLSELVQAVDRTGKAGKLTITITVRKATSQTQAVAAKVELKAPKEPQLETLLYPTPEGNLLAEDPRQSTLPLHTVAVPSAADLDKKSA